MENIIRIVSVIIGLIIFYFLGVFVAWDTNPINWWLFKTASGRVVFIILFVLMIVGTFNKDENENK